MRHRTRYCGSTIICWRSGPRCSAKTWSTRLDHRLIRIIIPNISRPKRNGEGIRQHQSNVCPWQPLCPDPSRVLWADQLELDEEGVVWPRAARVLRWTDRAQWTSAKQFSWLRLYRASIICVTFWGRGTWSSKCFYHGNVWACCWSWDSLQRIYNIITAVAKPHHERARSEREWLLSEMWRASSNTSTSTRAGVHRQRYPAGWRLHPCSFQRSKDKWATDSREKHLHSRTSRHEEQMGSRQIEELSTSKSQISIKEVIQSPTASPVQNECPGNSQAHSSFQENHRIHRI